MNNSKLLFLFLFISSTIGFAQSSGFQVDFANPESPVKALFYAAQKGDFNILHQLCDPYKLGDGDTKRVCALAIQEYKTDSLVVQELEKRRAEFVRYFENGKINGVVTYTTEEDGTEYAKVPFWFNHPEGGSRSNETMKMVKRNGNWYLYSF